MQTPISSKNPSLKSLNEDVNNLKKIILNQDANMAKQNTNMSKLLAMLAKSHGVVEAGSESPPIVVKDSKRTLSLAKSKARSRSLSFSGNNFETFHVIAFHLGHHVILLNFVIFLCLLILNLKCFRLSERI